MKYSHSENKMQGMGIENQIFYIAELKTFIHPSIQPAIHSQSGIMLTVGNTEMKKKDFFFLVLKYPFV